MKAGYRMKTYTKADGSTGKVPVKVKAKGGAKKKADARKKKGSTAKRSTGGKGLAARVSKLEGRVSNVEKRTTRLETFASGVAKVMGRRFAKK